MESQLSPKVLAARKNGRLGGLARAAKRTAEERKEWSAKGGRKTFETYGSHLMGFVAKKRKTVGRYKKPVAG